MHKKPPRNVSCSYFVVCVSDGTSLRSQFHVSWDATIWAVQLNQPLFLSCRTWMLTMLSQNRGDERTEVWKVCSPQQVLKTFCCALWVLHYPRRSAFDLHLSCLHSDVCLRKQGQETSRAHRSPFPIGKLVSFLEMLCVCLCMRERYGYMERLGEDISCPAWSLCDLLTWESFVLNLEIFWQ